ncbi:hypothetical protein LUX33_46760 [Actinomadura madurae]|nr:hypothetical protein [Actinomadura madurae]MCP9955132.1 hypothetical protein [Actinomadura madurae]
MSGTTTSPRASGVPASSAPASRTWGCPLVPANHTQRRYSSTAAGIRDGSARSRAARPGRVTRSSTQAARKFDVVSPPAISSPYPNTTISSWDSAQPSTSAVSRSSPGRARRAATLPAK